MATVNLADIPVDILERLMMTACARDPPPHNSADDASSSSESYPYTISEPDMYAEEDVLMPESEVTDVDKYIDIARAMLGPREGMYIIPSIIERLVCTTRDHCLPWIMSTAARTARWMEECFRVTHKCDLQTMAVAFEKACETNNARVLDQVLECAFDDHVDDSCRRLRRVLLQKACKCGNILFARALLDHLKYDDQDVYTALYFALPRGHLEVCDELLRRYPDMENYWNYKLFLEIDEENDAARRFFVKNYSGVWHVSDTMKEMGANGCSMRFILSVPLPAAACPKTHNKLA